jgi:hypothetical protein
MFGIEIDRDPAAGLSARHLRRLCRLGYFAKTNTKIRLERAFVFL